VPYTGGPDEKRASSPDELALLRRRVAELEDVEEALRASEEKYRLVADNATDMIWVSDLEFKFSYVSPSVARVLT